MRRRERMRLKSSSATTVFLASPRSGRGGLPGNGFGDRTGERGLQPLVSHRRIGLGQQGSRAVPGKVDSVYIRSAAVAGSSVVWGGSVDRYTRATPASGRAEQEHRAHACAGGRFAGERRAAEIRIRAERRAGIISPPLAIAMPRPRRWWWPGRRPSPAAAASDRGAGRRPGPFMERQKRERRGVAMLWCLKPLVSFNSPVRHQFLLSGSCRRTEIKWRFGAGGELDKSLFFF